MQPTIQARLPGSRQQSEIKDMQPGDSGWTVPWGMYADKDGNLWLNGNYPLDEEPCGTVRMQVMRSATDGSWQVDCSRCRNHRWSRDDGGYSGRFTPLPVSNAKF